MHITANTVVTFNYILTDDQGEIIDQEQGGDFSYLHGARNIVPGLERALEGKQAGDHVDAVVEPIDGYGEHKSWMVERVGRDMFDAGEDIAVGMQFHAENQEGSRIVITVVDIDDEHIMIDANHPLAGVRLNFAVDILEVRTATAEEVDHGHSHTGHHTH